MTNLDYMKLPQNNNPPKLRNVKNQVQLGGMMENCNPDMGCVCRRITSGRQKGRKRKEKLGPESPSLVVLSGIRRCYCGSRLPADGGE